MKLSSVYHDNVSIMFTVGTVAFVAFVRFLFKLYHARSRILELRRQGLPMPPYNPVLGHLPFANKIVSGLPKDAHPNYLPDMIRRTMPDLGPVYYLDTWPFGPQMLVVASPGSLYQITQEHSLPKYHAMKTFLQPITGGGDIVTMEGQMWKTWRGIFNPGFSASHLMTLTPGIVEETVTFCDIVQTHMQNQTRFHMKDMTDNLAMDVIGRVVLDTQLGSQRRRNPLVDGLRMQIRWLIFGANPFEKFNPFRPFVHWYNTRRMDKYVSRELKDRMADYDGSESVQTAKRTKTVVDLALAAYLSESPGEKPSQGMDNKFQKFAMSQIKLFLFSGHDTTSSSICYIFYILSVNPTALSRIRAEHDEVFGSDLDETASIVVENPFLLNQLPYTLAVIKETLRMDRIPRFLLLRTGLAHWSGRRAANNRIRGPQSALTDFLASNNISAVQIRDDYERRRQAAEQQAQQEAAANGEVEEDEKTEEREETVEQKKKRKRQEEKAIAKIKQSKDFKRRKASKPGETDDDEDIAWDMYKKSKPLPGQLENCDICDKRFTVTAYSKTGPEGGLLCAKCSKSVEADQKKEKPKKNAANRNKRRQVQSNLLDGIVQLGPKSLQELCVEKVADNINDIDEFGDLPPALLDRLSQILSKRRVLTSRTLDLFLRPDLDTISLYDCGKLEPEDFKKIFAIIPKLQELSLHNAGQIKDEVIEYILERGVPIKHLQLEAANLVSDEKWRDLFQRHGPQLETLKLSWLDFSMDDETVAHLAAGCPNITRLKLKKLFKIGDKSLESIAEMKNLKHLSLRFVQPTSAETITKLIAAVGPNLRTLSLEKFENADDSVLQTIHTCCRHLNKFRFTDNDFCTDKGFVDLFTDWDNPPLSFLDLASNRDLDYTNPDGPEDPIGLASEGFKAMMKHSRSLVERLDISSCRHISHAAFLETFDGVKTYPCLKDVNISFLTMIDTPVAVGIFKSCPQLRKLTAFGCFNVRDVLVPPGVALIGLPNAHESIVVEGEMIGDL